VPVFSTGSLIIEILVFPLFSAILAFCSLFSTKPNLTEVFSDTQCPSFSRLQERIDRLLELHSNARRDAADWDPPDFINRFVNLKRALPRDTPPRSSENTGQQRLSLKFVVLHKPVKRPSDMLLANIAFEIRWLKLQAPALAMVPLHAAGRRRAA
jgi:hypothetical protein